MKVENKKSLKEQFIMIFEGYKILHGEFNKPIFLSNTLASILNAIVPFVNFYFSSLILNELIGNKEKNKLLELVVLTLFINLLVLSLKALAYRWSKYCMSNEGHILCNLYSKKLISMDYVDVENSEVQQSIVDIKEHQFGMGFGIRELLYTFEVLIQSLIQVLLAVAIVFQLLKSNVPDDSVYNFLDSNLIVLFFLSILCLSIFFAPYLKLIGGKIFEKAANINNKGNRIFMFYVVNVLYNSEKGKDLRIYEQQDIINNRYKGTKEVRLC